MSEQDRMLYYIFLPGSGREEGAHFNLFDAPFSDKDAMVEQRRKFLGDENLEGVYCVTIPESAVKRENAMRANEGTYSYSALTEEILPEGKLGPQEVREMNLVGDHLPFMPAEEYLFSGGEQV